MKKLLLASTALIAFGAVSAQAAEPIKLSLGGYATEYVGFANNQQTTAFSGGTLGAIGMSNAAARAGAGGTGGTAPANGKTFTDVQSDININFIGSTKLDNGITAAVEVDTFGSQRNDSRNVNTNCGKTVTTTGSGGTLASALATPHAAISSTNGTSASTAAGACANSDVKRAFVTLSGNFGALIVGERENVGYIVHNSAPDVGTIGLQDGIWFQWVANPYNHRVYTATNASRYDERANKIEYVTPAFYGFAAGFSYTPSISTGSQGHTTITSNSDVQGVFLNGSGLVNGSDFGNGDLYVGGIAYNNTFGDLSVKADFGVGQANIANLRVFQGGAQVGYAGFTVGGSIFNRHVDNSATLGSLNTVFNSRIGAGLPTVSLVGGGINNVAKTAAFAGQSWDAGISYKTGPYAVSFGTFQDRTRDDVGSADSTAVYVLSGAYTMGPGVALKASAAHVDYKDGAGYIADQNHGYVFVTGVRLDF